MQSMRRAFRTMAVLVLVFGSQIAACKDGHFSVTGMSDEEVKTFYLNLISQVNAGNKVAIADLVSYPIAVTLESKTSTIKNKSEFIRSYDLIFNKRIKSSISETTIDDLVGTYEGVSTNGGAIWFSRDVDKKIKIIAINN